MATTEVDLGRTTDLEVRPMSGHTGAEIHGVDLRSPLPPATVEQIRAALLRWKVVFFRDQPITQAEHVAFARQFGSPTPAHPTLPAVFPDFPEILLLDGKGVPRPDRDDPGWHTDVTFVAEPPMGSILRNTVVPEVGGDTQWTNLVAAYEMLTPSVRDLIDGLQALHQNVLAPTGKVELSEREQDFQSRTLRVVHPVVRVHPETGEKGLYVNPKWTSHIVNVSRRESRYVLAMLYEHLSDPRFTCRFRWHPGSIAFWDNRTTAHLPPDDVPAGARRVGERITLDGDLPVGPDGFTSYAL